MKDTTMAAEPEAEIEHLRLATFAIVNSMPNTAALGR
jgi:hypothetical protein